MAATTTGPHNFHASVLIYEKTATFKSQTDKFSNSISYTVFTYLFSYPHLLHRIIKLSYISRVKIDEGK